MLCIRQPEEKSELQLNNSCILHDENTLPHTSLLICEFLTKNNIVMILQPTVMALYDFFLFPWKRTLKGHCFVTTESKLLSEVKAISVCYRNVSQTKKNALRSALHLMRTTLKGTNTLYFLIKPCV